MAIKFAEICRAGGKLAYKENLPKKLPTFLFLSDLSLFIMTISGAYNERMRELFKNPHQ